MNTERNLKLNKRDFCHDMFAFILNEIYKVVFHEMQSYNEWLPMCLYRMWIRNEKYAENVKTLFFMRKEGIWRRR